MRELGEIADSIAKLTLSEPGHIDARIDSPALARCIDELRHAEVEVRTLQRSCNRMKSALMALKERGMIPKPKHNCFCDMCNSIRRLNI